MRRIRWVSLFTALLVAFLLLVLPRVPPAYLPWTPLDLGALPVPVVTRIKLERMALDPPYCRAALTTSALTYAWLDTVVPQPGCPVPNAVRVTRASLGLSSGFLATCRLAGALDFFFRHDVEPDAERDLGTRVMGIRHLGTYACRTIANEATPSEHASANAIDIAGFVLADGRQVTVGRDWHDPGRYGRFLHDVRDGACGVFHVVLSPDFNAAHRGHLHLDMGPYRFCR